MNTINRIPASWAAAILVLCLLVVGYMEDQELKINEKIMGVTR